MLSQAVACLFQNVSLEEEKRGERCKDTNDEEEMEKGKRKRRKRRRLKQTCDAAVEYLRVYTHGLCCQYVSRLSAWKLHGSWRTEHESGELSDFFPVCGHVQSEFIFSRDVKLKRD